MIIYSTYMIIPLKSYIHLDGKRRDMVEIDLCNGNIGVAQLIGFVEMQNIPGGSPTDLERCALIRWLSVSRRSNTRDSHDRPLCDYPLSSNHCLWEWSNTGRNRKSFDVRGFMRIVNRQRLWHHVEEEQREQAILSERRARYDVVDYKRIIRHANISVDPTTGHMLQTIQMI